MKLKTLLLGSFMFCLLWFLGWEAYAVYDARAKTPEIFAPYRDEGSLAMRWSDLDARRQDILLTVEDPAFFTHAGVDVRTAGAGKTTVTQSIAKHLYFEKFTPGFAKIEQSLIALFVIDPVIDKRTQMNTFLDVVYMGSKDGKPVTGLANAARAYFGKPVTELSDFEFVQLVAAMVGPNAFQPGSPENLSRTSRIQALLRGKCAPQSNGDVYYEMC